MDEVQTQEKESATVKEQKETGKQTGDISAESTKLYDDGSETSDLETYVKQQGGTFSMLLFDADGKRIQNGAELHLDTNYEVVLSFTLPNGILPGSYTTTIPAEGFNFTAESGEYKIKDGTVLGTWSIGAGGVLTSTFNETANGYTNMVVNASFTIRADEDAEKLSFNNDIYVIYKAPDEGVDDFTGYKSMNFLDENGKAADSSVNGTLDSDSYTNIRNAVTVNVNNDTTLAGKILRDSLGDTQYFSDEDEAKGISLMLTTADGNYTVTLTTENGLVWGDKDDYWSYTFPEKLDGIDLTKAEVTRIRATYDSTIKESTMSKAEVRHSNTAYIEENGEELVSIGTNIMQKHDIGTGENSINKTGVREGNTVTWTMSGTIVGAVPGTDKYSNIRFQDNFCVMAGSGWGSYQYGTLPDSVQNMYRDAVSNMTVTLSYKGNTYTVKSYDQAGEDDLFAYKLTFPNTSAMKDGSDGADSSTGTRESAVIRFGMRCDCTEDTCSTWNGACKNMIGNGFCGCWLATSEVGYTMTYSTDISALEEAFGAGWRVANKLQFTGSVGNWNGAGAEIPLGQTLDKSLKAAPTVDNGYTASYKIEVNKDCQDLSAYKNITLNDTMADTLVYVPGTMKITAVAADGSSTVLDADADYVLEKIAANQLEIQLKKLGAYKYVLEYDAMVVIDGSEASIDYNNSATLTIDGEVYKKESESRTLAKIEYSAQKFAVTVEKTDADDAAILIPGAEYGLYTEGGELIASDTTDENGQIKFMTNVRKGIILKEHTAYYIKEIKAPEGYQLDEESHLLYFCTTAGGDQSDDTFGEDFLRIYSTDTDRNVIMQVSDALEENKIEGDDNEGETVDTDEGDDDGGDSEDVITSEENDKQETVDEANSTKASKDETTASGKTKTGDESHASLWILLLIISAGCIVIIKRRKI